MGDLEPRVFDLGLVLGSIPVILQLIADSDLFNLAAGALVVGFAFLLAYKLTCGSDGD